MSSGRENTLNGPPLDRPEIACSYHKAILNMEIISENVGVHPMDKFLGEGSGEQSAVFIRNDTGELSLAKVCTCPTPQDFSVE
jgi:hypothetical protein